MLPSALTCPARPLAALSVPCHERTVDEQAPAVVRIGHQHQSDHRRSPWRWRRRDSRRSPWRWRWRDSRRRPRRCLRRRCATSDRPVLPPPQHGVCRSAQGGANGWPIRRARAARPRRPRQRRRTVLVPRLADQGAVPVRPRCARGAVPGGPRPARRPRRRVGRHRRRPGPAPPVPAGPGQGGPHPDHLGRGGGNDRRRARPHDPHIRTGPDSGVLPRPGQVDGVAHDRGTVHRTARWGHDLGRRPVRGSSGGLGADLRRPDRCAAAQRLAERHLPAQVGREQPGHPYPGRTPAGGSPLPGSEGGRDRPGLRRQHDVRRRMAARPTRHRRRARDGDGPCDPA